jgi:hypothetical protein
MSAIRRRGTQRALVYPGVLALAVWLDARWTNQFRHCKPFLVIGWAQQLLSKAGIPSALPDGATR